MAQSSEDIQNNNFQLGPSYPITDNSVTSIGVLGGSDNVTSNFPGSSSVLAQFVARNIGNLGEESSPSSIGSITYNDEYLEDPFPDLTLENLQIPKEYVDPSLGYVFVNNHEDNQQGFLDNSQALLQQLEELGVRVNDDYYSLDFEVNTTSSVDSIVSTTSETTDVSPPHDSGEKRLDVCAEKQDEKDSSSSSSSPAKDTNFVKCVSPSGISDSVSEKEHNLEKLIKLVEEGESEDEFSIDIEDLDHEVAEAEILPTGGVKVTYDNYKKNYRPRISSHQNFLRYLELVHDRSEEAAKGETKPQLPRDGKHSFELYKRILTSVQKKFKLQEKVTNLSALQNKYSKKLMKLIAEEMTYDTMTPDSGVHENFTNLSAEEQEKQREEWKAELAKTEEEIQTLRQVLGSKVKHAQDLKRRLGITVWREFTEDFNQSMKTVRESQTTQYVQSLQVYRKMSGAFVELGEAIYQQPVYQKTAGAIGAVGEKTSSLFGGIGAKFGQLKETPTFKSFEERVGGVYSAARTRMGGSGSNSTQDFEEALKEAEGEKAAANGGTVPTSTTPGTEVSQPAAS
ncbi:uncharacterized protein LOC135211131 isoform X3 [Macrobrachium nipponense]|uniref:uncharacterized protein LOC135211131 isoform X3 n=1 Tax=Macrobrachium nipponense TaxID=159736 RepID=UPI0030C7C03C